MYTIFSTNKRSQISMHDSIKLYLSPSFITSLSHRPTGTFPCAPLSQGFFTAVSNFAHCIPKKHFFDDSTSHDYQDMPTAHESPPVFLSRHLFGSSYESGPHPQVHVRALADCPPSWSPSTTLHPFLILSLSQRSVSFSHHDVSYSILFVLDSPSKRPNALRSGLEHGFPPLACHRSCFSFAPYTPPFPSLVFVYPYIYLFLYFETAPSLPHRPNPSNTPNPEDTSSVDEHITCTYIPWINTPNVA